MTIAFSVHADSQIVAIHGVFYGGRDFEQLPRADAGNSAPSPDSRQYGNMSSATIMFVLKEMLQPNTAAGRGCTMAFGLGLTVESMLFQTAGD